MAISAQCPHCSAKLKLKNPDLVGKKVRCPSCQEPFRVEAAAGAAEAPARRAKAKETAPPAEDDWLNDLNSFGDEPADEGPVATAPPVVGRKKKKKPTVSAPKQSLRDEDGEFPLAMHRLMMIGTGLLGGLIGVVIWGLIIYGTGYEVGYVAILVGFLAGTGVRLGASRWDFGWWPAMTAVAIAMAAIVGGKIAGVELLLSNVRELATHDNVLISELAGEVAMEWEEAGRFVAPPEEELADIEDLLSLGPDDLPKLFPSDVWTEAVARWEQLPEADREARREEQRQFAEMGGEYEAADLFSPIDLLWFAFACTGAFKIAAGWEDDD